MYVQVYIVYMCLCTPDVLDSVVFQRVLYKYKYIIQFYNDVHWNDNTLMLFDYTYLFNNKRIKYLNQNVTGTLHNPYSSPISL